ncbi:MAG: helix-turn-helix domain-containing protein [Candidatus Gracilibacteria bacterium]
MRIKAYLKQVFSTLGLTEGEADIMAALLKKPGSDANALKSKLGFSTAGTYKILGALSEKGYIKPSQEKTPLTFTPIPLGKLAQTFERNSRHLQRTAQKLKELNTLSALPEHVEIYEQDELTDFYLNIPYKLNDFIWCVGSFEAVMKFFGPGIEKEFIKKRVKKGIQADAIIFDNSSFSKELAGRDGGEKRETKFIQNGEYPLEFSYLFGDTYLSFYKDAEGKIKMVKTEAPEVAKAKMIQYQRLWNSTLA